MELKNLAKNTAILASPKIVGFFLRIVRSKINAIALGTTGVGIVSQLTTLTGDFSHVSTMGMNIGAQKMIAEKKGSEIGAIPSILKTYLLLIVPMIIGTFIIGLIFNKPITNFILGKNELNKYFLIVFIVFPFMTLNSVAESILGGFKKFKYISLKEIIISLVTLVLFIPLVLLYHIKGAVVTIALSIIITFFIGLVFAFPKTLFKLGVKGRDFIKAKFSKSYSKEILTVGSIGMTVGYYKIFCEITSRSILVNQLGVANIGVYAPIIAWSGLFTGFIYPSIWQFLFPRLCEAKNDLEITNIVNDVFRLMTFITIPFVFIGISLRDLILPLFYSNEFIGAALFLPLHFIGVFVMGWLTTLWQIFIPTGRVKKLVPFSLIINTLYLCTIYFFTSRIGLWAWAIKDSIVPFMALIACLIYFHFEIGFSIKRKNIFIMIYALCGAVVIWIFNFNIAANILIAVILTGIAIAFTKPRERAELKKYLLKILKI